MVPIFGSSLFDLTCILAYCPNFGVHYILNKNLENMASTLRAKINRKIPTVLTREEVAEVFEYLSGTYLIIAKLLYGCGLTQLPQKLEFLRHFHDRNPLSMRLVILKA